VTKDAVAIMQPAPSNAGRRNMKKGKSVTIAGRANRRQMLLRDTGKALKVKTGLKAGTSGEDEPNRKATPILM
jgi:hypothetical protein